MAEAKKKATGYDKYVNWKLFILPVVLSRILDSLPSGYLIGFEAQCMSPTGYILIGRETVKEMIEGLWPVFDRGRARLKGIDAPLRIYSLLKKSA